MENFALKDEMQFEKIFYQGAGLKMCLTNCYISVFNC